MNDWLIHWFDVYLSFTIVMRRAEKMEHSWFADHSRVTPKNTAKCKKTGLSNKSFINVADNKWEQNNHFATA